MAELARVLHGGSAHEDVHLADDLRPPSGDGPASPRDVLLTGVTGFLGGELAASLLRSTALRLHCLVRGTTARSAADRLAASCARRGLDRSRVSLVEGDLGALGEAATALAGIDAIVHCAANVNLFAPYDALRASNVLGAREILAFAASAGPRPVHFVSTGGVFLSPHYRGQTVFEDEPLAPESVPANGYARSKWVADRMMARARQRGFAVNVYRPAFVGWHAETGAYGEHDLVALLLSSSLAARCAPRLDLQINATPVDRVARSIAALVGGAPARGGTYHLVSRRATPFVDLAALAGLPVIEFPDWTAAVAREAPAYAKFAALVCGAQLREGSGSVELSYAHDRTYDDRRLREALGAAYQESPDLDERYLSVFARASTR